MAYIYVQTIPNHIPVSSGLPIHYCDLEFMIYKSEKLCGQTGNAIGRKIKKGPQILITAKVMPAQSKKTDDALCIASDIPSGGYSFTVPQGWGCSGKYDSEAGTLTFVLTAPLEENSSFTAAAIKINSFFTTAQAGVCTLDICVENFSLFVPDVQDSTFSIPLAKNYNLEILDFTANGQKGASFLNHAIPAVLHWNAVCDSDTPLHLLADGIFDSALQEFTGEKKLEKRDPGDHTYTLKMVLTEGEKTESVRIMDTRWKRLRELQEFKPDFSAANSIFASQNAIWLFYKNKLRKSFLRGGMELTEWTVFDTYSGNADYPAVPAAAVLGDCFYLIGGVKRDSKKMFYSVCSLKGENRGWTDYAAGQDNSMAGGIAACDRGGASDWLVYAKQVGEAVWFMEYDPLTQIFPAAFFIEIEGICGFDVSIKNDVLYFAAVVKDGIILKTCKRGQMKMMDAGKIDSGTAWAKWINGNNAMYLLAEKGIYGGKYWTNMERFQPPYQKGSYPWLGTDGGKVIGLVSEGEAGQAAVWSTDRL